MEILIEILLRILRFLFYPTIVGVVICMVGVVIYFLLPWIFRKFVSPKLNATYEYDSNDFKDGNPVVEEELTPQINRPRIEINKETGIYSITFGEVRNLLEGIVEVRCNGTNYTTHKSLGRKKKALRIREVNESEGSDKLGKFKQTKILYDLEGETPEIIALINDYINKNYITFELKFPENLKGTATGEFEKLITKFPSFLNESPNINIFTYRDSVFAYPNDEINSNLFNFFSKSKATSSPVLFYDDELNCFIVSPLERFLNSAIAQEGERINCGFQGEIQKIPENYTQKFILMFGKGINKPMEKLGDILLKYHDSERKSSYANIAVSHLSYWTDNGAYYYYRTKDDMNYEETMVQIKNYFDEQNIPLQSYNFDSWWYLKYQSTFSKVLSTLLKPLYRVLGGGLFGNILRWETDPAQFTTDLETFHKERFQKPIIAHSRRWDARSPYLDKFEFETDGDHAVPLNFKFWDWLMKFAKRSGIDVYEQDWLKTQVNSVSVLREDITAAGTWLKNMAEAANKNNVDIFYCMETPGMILYSIKHPNITITRSSGDYNHRWPPTYRYVHCSLTNILLNAVGLNSHQDCYRTKYGLLSEHYPEFMTIVENLTAGLVCPSDKEDDVDWELLQKTCRRDGLLYKPDKAITANDLMFKKHRKYYICDTSTERRDISWKYILVMNLWPKRVKETHFSPKELGYGDEEQILYNFLNGQVFKVNKDDKIPVGRLNKYEFRYYIMAPLTNSGMALIGCPDKYVTCSKKQFPEVKWNENSLTFSIEDLKGAETTVYVYSPVKPSHIRIVNGENLASEQTVDTSSYIGATKIVKLNLTFTDSTYKTIKIKKK
ncbi:MAG: hypothetical protein R6U96_16185 [Promethearchaeia archaeon]